MNVAAEQRRASKVVLITGASSGIGLATAERLAAAGHRVFGTSRADAPVGPKGVHMLTLDVADDNSVQRCVDAVLAEAGCIDVLINNAGRIVHGPIEEVPVNAAQRLFETNFWGTVRVTNAVLPYMRKQHRGHVLVVGSIAAWVAVPLNGFYSATKAALARYTDSLRAETQHLGVRVVLVEPGDFASSLWHNAERYSATTPDYVRLIDGVQSAILPILAKAPSPEPCASLLARIVDEEDPEPIYRIGSYARRLPLMRVLMPARFFERGLRKRFGMELLR